MTSRRSLRRKNQPAPSRTHWPLQTPSDCWDWITPDDIVRHALAAFYMVSRDLARYPIDPTEENGEFRNGRYDFALQVGEIFAMRLKEAGYKCGAPGFDNNATLTLKLWSAPLDTPDLANIHDIHRAQYQNENGG